MSIRSKHDGGPPYMVQYWHRGVECGFTLPAPSWDEAQERLRSIGATGKIVGSNVQTMHANALTLPLVALWVPLVCWWRNLWGRES